MAVFRLSLGVANVYSVNMAKLLSDFLVGFYRFWHGTLHLSGAGFLLRFFARWLLPLCDYPLTIPRIGTIRLDFRMDYAFTWMNFLLNDTNRDEGLLSVLTSHFSPTTLFWDVGANIGLISGNLFQTFPNATFCLFEPNPDLTQRLAGLFFAKKQRPGY